MNSVRLHNRCSIPATVYASLRQVPSGIEQRTCIQVPVKRCWFAKGERCKEALEEEKVGCLLIQRDKRFLRYYVKDISDWNMYDKYGRTAKEIIVLGSYYTVLALS